MILYVNGDSHAAAAEAVNQHAFAEDDPALFYMGRAPHPANLAVSWGRLLSEIIKTTFVCQAESGGSNSRIIRTTRNWVARHQKDWHRILVVISWSTWEREEWLHDSVYYQVGSSGIDDVPQQLQEKYKHFVIGTDWHSKTQQAHEEIWQLHQELKTKNIRHIFFNGNNDFSMITDRRNWGENYINPYDPDYTYNQSLQRAGFQTVSPASWHYGADAHRWWARYLKDYIITHNLI